MLAPPARRNDFALTGPQETQAGDHEFAGDDDHDNPGRYNLIPGHKTNERGAYKHFVGQGIHQLSKDSDPVFAARQPTVPVIGQGGQQEDQ